MTYGYHPTKQNLGGYVIGGDFMTYAPGVWSKLIAIYGPANMVDIGCGEGHTAQWFATKGVHVQGIDGCEPERDLIPVQARIVHDFEEGPLPKSAFPPAGWDLGWACEFVEHVNEAALANVLDCFSRCRVLAMTHAVPGQGGHHHVNCQPADYWRAKLSGIGLHANVPLSECLRDLTDAHWVKQTLLVFEHEGGR